MYSLNALTNIFWKKIRRRRLYTNVVLGNGYRVERGIEGAFKDQYNEFYLYYMLNEIVIRFTSNINYTKLNGLKYANNFSTE